MCIHLENKVTLHQMALETNLFPFCYSCHKNYLKHKCKCKNCECEPWLLSDTTCTETTQWSQEKNVDSQSNDRCYDEIESVESQYLKDEKYLIGGGDEGRQEKGGNNNQISPILNADLNHTLILSMSKPNHTGKIINERVECKECSRIYLTDNENNSCCIHLMEKHSKIYFSVSDVYGIIKDITGWSRQVKSYNLTQMMKKMQSVPEYAITAYCVCTDKIQYYISERALSYILIDLQLSEPSHFCQNKVCKFLLDNSSKSTLGNIMYPILLMGRPVGCHSENEQLISNPADSKMDDSGLDSVSNMSSVSDLSTSSFEDLVKHQGISDLVRSLRPPPSSKFLPPLTDIVSEVKNCNNCDENMKEFVFDCQKYGLTSNDDQQWYAKLISKISELGDDMSILLEKEIKYHDKRFQSGDIDHRDFNVVDDYRAHTSWAVRLFMEILLQNKSWYPLPDQRRDHAIRKTRKTYFCLHTMLNIKNSNHSGPLQKQLGDIMYTKHTDIKYFYNVFSHLSILDSLPTVIGRQTKLAAERNIEKILQQRGELEYVLLWDNFVKTHIIYDPIVGNAHSQSNEILNKTLIGLSSTSKCGECVDKCECIWTQDVDQKRIKFEEIFPNEAEKKEKAKYEQSQLANALVEASELFDMISGLRNVKAEQFPDHIKEKVHIDPFNDVCDKDEETTAGSLD